MARMSQATTSNVASSATSVTVFADNTGARQRLLYNDSTAILYLKFGSGAASNSSYTIQIPAGGYYEFPVGAGGAIYNGPCTGIWSAANGNARITEA